MARSLGKRSLRGPLMAALAGGAAFTAVAAAPWYFQPRTMIHSFQRWGGKSGLLFEVETDDPVFALTFDDGPHPPFTDSVLDILADHNAHATFFVMGEQAERHPLLLERMVSEGHETANHFYDDRPTVALNDRDVLGSLRRTEALLGGQNRGRLVRPAGGLIRTNTLRRLTRHGYTTVLGSAYTSDPLLPPVSYMQWALMRMLEPGRIMILHDGRRDRRRTVETLPAVLEEAARLGLRAVTVSDLLTHAR